MWDNISIQWWSVLPKCKSSSSSQMNIASPEQNNFSVLDWLKACTFYACSCLVLLCLPSHSELTPTSAPWKTNDKWLRNNFLLGFNSLANHGGHFNCFFFLPTYAWHIFPITKLGISWHLYIWWGVWHLLFIPWWFCATWHLHLWGLCHLLSILWWFCKILHYIYDEFVTLFHICVRS